MVSAASMVCMGVSALIGIGAPVLLFLTFRKRFGSKPVPALVGAAAFVLFAMVLESLVHRLVLQPQPDGSMWLKAYPFWYMLYGCLMAGLFEETARFASFQILKRKYDGIGTALAYGVGHGGAESILLLGVAMITNIALSLMVNSGTLPAQVPQALGQTLSTTAPAMFLVGALERLLAITVQIALSVVVFYSVYRRGVRWLFPLAILLHALVDAPAALMQAGVLNSIALVEGIVAALAILLAWFAIGLHRRLKTQ